MPSATRKEVFKSQAGIRVLLGGAIIKPTRALKFGHHLKRVFSRARLRQGMVAATVPAKAPAGIFGNP